MVYHISPRPLPYRIKSSKTPRYTINAMRSKGQRPALLVQLLQAYTLSGDLLISNRQKTAGQDWPNRRSNHLRSPIYTKELSW